MSKSTGKCWGLNSWANYVYL